ncbi:uncharacterized protein JCM10292_007388 [Rhodotorula paludigena]|uniref:uncharacterized protein n=1 Tax=Rhodotorula paludigena TaxID=86838 RepID=UPI00317B963E
MSPTSLAALQKLKRTQLQALCKEHGIKANGKTDALVAALADKLCLGADMTPATTPAPQRASKARTAPTASASNLSNRGNIASGSQNESTYAQQNEENDMEYRKVLQSLRDDFDAVLVAREECDERLERLEAKVAKQDEVLAAFKEQLEEFDIALDQPPATCGACETLEASFDSLRRDLLSRLDALQPTPAQHAAATEKVAQQTRAVSFASPTLSDAPPTQSLLSFSSPAASPVQHATPRPRPSVSSRKATPFKLGSVALDTPTSGSTPASALPSHMIAVAASAARRSPRAASSTARLSDSTIEPQSPVPLVSGASLGKHARYSDASDVSIGLQAVVSPELDRMVQGTPGNDLAGAEGFFTAPNSVRKPVASDVRAEEKDGHARKRIRVSSGAHSTGTMIDRGELEDEEDEEDAEDEEDPNDSFTAEVGAAQESVEEQEEGEDDDEVRDYLVRTKTGDSPASAPKASHDPSFFASLATQSPARRATSVSFVDENAPPVAAASGGVAGRKSLPLSTLPFPIVSPFRAAASTSARKFPASAGKATVKTFFGADAANRPAAASPGAGLFASATKRARSGTVSTPRVPPTPPAARTLFGTELGGFGDEAQEGARFGEGEGALGDEMVSPVKGGWKWECGAFGAAA